MWSCHYDHLDVTAIRELGPELSYYVPLGVKAWFTNKFPEYKHVKQMDWRQEHVWQHSTDNEKYLTLVCTPSQHESGRRGFRKNQTLWCSWTILGSKKYFFAGFLISISHFIIIILEIPDIALSRVEKIKKQPLHVQHLKRSVRNMVHSIWHRPIPT